MRTISEKIKIKLIDYWHLLFKSAADNHIRISRCKEDSSGNLRCEVTFNSYSSLKKFQKKLRAVTVSLSGAVAMIIVAIFVSPLIFNPSRSGAANYTWTQTAWDAAGSSGSEIAYPNTGTTYDSKEASVNTETSGEVKLYGVSGTQTDTTNANFTAGTTTNIYVASDNFYPQKPNTYNCDSNNNSFCQSGRCDTTCQAKLANGTVGGDEASDCTSGIFGADFTTPASSYCHATATSCVDYNLGTPWERANGYELCSSNDWYKSCSSGTWGAQQDSPDTADDYCQGNAGLGENGGYDLKATCASGAAGGFTNPSCVACGTGYLAASTTTCNTACATNNDAKCWSAYHCNASDACVVDLSSGNVCVESSDCTSGVCTSATATGIFVTAGTWTGGLGGRTGADDKCNNDTNKPAGATKVKALLSVSADDNIYYLSIAGGDASHYDSNSAIYRTDGATMIASNWADLLDGNLLANVTLGTTPYIWSGSDKYGWLAAYHCSNWTNGTSSVSGRKGIKNAIDFSWLQDVNKTCDNSYGLYCVYEMTTSALCQ
ncbi:MAG: hypothetical protein ACD_11C00076G0010 [uncultured bacterium]|nr:MAG: hypothetical protein ACD_11C00076G0010 [uncultured bacterium]